MYKIDRRGEGGAGGVQKSFSRNIPHFDLKVASSQAKIDKNLANSFLKTKPSVL